MPCVGSMDPGPNSTVASGTEEYSSSAAERGCLWPSVTAPLMVECSWDLEDMTSMTSSITSQRMDGGINLMSVV